MKLNVFKLLLSRSRLNILINVNFDKLNIYVLISRVIF